MNLVELLRRHAAERGTHCALILQAADAAEQAATLDFSTLEQRVRALAAELQAQGASGERVLVVCPPGLDFIVALSACFFAGAVAVPCRPPQLKIADRGLVHFGALLADSQPVLALTPAEHVERANWFSGKSGLALRWLAAVAPDAQAAAWREPKIADDGLALLQYTSGSTGAPRGVPITHANLASNIAFIAGRYGVVAESVVVNWLPPHHDMGLIGHTLLPLMLGCTSVHMSPLDFLKQPRRWLAAVTQHRGTHGGGPNFGYELCVRAISPHERSGLDLSSWYAAPCGAEPVRADTAARFCEAFAPFGFRPETFAPCYGLAESTLMVSGAGGCGGYMTTLRADRAALASGHLQTATADAGVVTLVGCGAPAPGAQVAIISADSSAPCTDGQIGEIWITGPSTAAGYWRRDSDAWFATLPGSETPWLRTGDLGALRGGELFVTGRLKDLIIIAGRNVYPQDLERSAAASHPALVPERVAAFGNEGEWGEEVVLVCEVRREQRAQLEPEQVFAAIRAALMQDCELAPAAILLVPDHSVPVTGSGKIRHSECRTRYATNKWEVIARSDGVSSGVTPQAAPHAPPPRGDVPATERYLIACLADMLRRPPQWVQPHQKLSELGLDSLGRVELTLKLEAGLNLRLPANELVADLNVAQLAQRLSGLTRKPDRAAAPGLDTAAAPIELPLLPLQREFLWDGVQQPGRFATVLILRSPAGTLEPRLAQSLAHLEQEFDALRLRFHPRNGSWHQVLGAVGGGVKFSRVDASAADSATRRSLRQQLQEQLVGDLDITQGPLLRAIWLDCGADQSGVLAMAIHHLVSDGLSIVALLTSFERNYRSLVAGTGLGARVPSPGFGAWAMQLQRLSTSPEILAEQDYWRQICGPGQLPAVSPDALIKTATTGPRQLNEAATARFLKRYPSAQQQHDALLAAFALAAAEVLGVDEILLRLENHGRHAVLGLEPNLSAGWMICQHPLRLRGLSGSDAVSVQMNTAEALLAVPHFGLGYGLLRHMQGLLGDCTEPRLGFTFRGRLDDTYRAQADFRVLEVGAVAPALWANPAQPDLRLLAYLRGNTLVWNADYRPAIHTAPQAARLVERLAAVIGQMIA